MIKIEVKDVDVSHAKVVRALDTPLAKAVLRAAAEKIIASAKAIFLAQVLHTHGVTPPPYLTAFSITPIPGSAKLRLSNDDPAAFWIEFGAYLPQNAPFEKYTTHEQILRYAPLRRAVDIAEAGEV